MLLVLVYTKTHVENGALEKNVAKCLLEKGFTGRKLSLKLLRLYVPEGAEGFEILAHFGQASPKCARVGMVSIGHEPVSADGSF